jgi:hypothetical protein
MPQGWYSNQKSVPTVKESIKSMSKHDQLEATHKALGDTDSNDLLKPEEPVSQEAPDEELEVADGKLVNLNSKEEVNRESWP